VEFKNLTYIKEQALAIITLNRPQVYNALNDELIDELGQVVAVVEEDPQVRAVILTGGSKFFVSGADIAHMANADTLKIYWFVNKSNRVFDRLEELPCPTIAAINGPALGGGCELAMCCDFRIAGESAVFGQPEILFGILPGAGGTQRLARLIGPSRAKELIYLGEHIKASQALDIGLVNRVVADEQVMDEAKKFAAKLMEKPAIALRFAKEAINHGMNTTLVDGKSFEQSRFAMIFSSQDQKEGMKAFLEKRRPVFTHS